ncbi:MAG: [NiFe]-hydrogenase assembly chaperone HybE [Paracoccaceae bacterium]|nr:[NiFe]-hydrogenase assembly chaperone HybE [Paracoccaceae bacterium]
MTGFEGSYLGAADKISPAAIMECKICWTPYDPAEGDDSRQIDPGTAFTDLPDDWSCPTCSAAPEQFLVREDPGAADIAETARLDAVTSALLAEFTEVWNAKMRDVPIVNKLLRVQAVGFRLHEGRPLGVLLSPWFMNLVLLPAEAEDWSDLTPGAKEIVHFPSGPYEFVHNTRDQIGGYKACSLFSAMGDFSTQAAAVDVANAVMVALFDAENRAETDRSADIRAAREADLAAEAEDHLPTVDPVPSRRQVITGGLGAGEAG